MASILTLEQLLYSFQTYNLTIWPLQIVAYVLGLAALFLAVRKTDYSSRAIAGILAFFWLWSGAVYLFLFLRPGDRPWYWAVALFAIQGVLFLRQACRPRLAFGEPKGIYGVVGVLLIAYSMVGYLWLGRMLGHLYPQAPPFGLTPCPLTIFTLGILLLAVGRVPVSLLVIPFLWSLAGVVPVSIGLLEDIGMIGAGLIAVPMVLYRNKQEADQARPPG